ncbi:MAG: efflux RND transporter permease subunit [Candidatus Eisenbacteria bacterium]
MRIADGSLKRPVTVAMATLAVVLFGAVALSRLGVELLPNISYPSLTVRTDLPDAAPGDVEQFVTKPVEEGVGVVPGLVHMHSVSRPGQSEVTLEFASNTRMDLASLAVREKLDLVTLPREARRSAILRFDPSLDPILRTRLSGGSNLQRLRRIADRTVKSDLEGVAGVAAVRIAGGEEEEIQVDVDAGRLSSVGLSLADVTRRLGEENVNVAGGSLTDGQSAYLVRATNQFLSPDEIGQVILASRPGGVVRLSDVATVRRGARDRDVIARVGGAEAVEIAVYKEGDANTVTVARAVKAKLKKLDLPADMKLVTVADQSKFIQSAIDDVTSSAILGGLLAILVIFAFLRHAGSTLTIALAIPISVMATFIVMYRLGLSLNLMSLGGLALGVGMLVDDGIVVLESIFQRREAGDGPFEAASKGTSMVAMAVTASTLTTVAVFFPLVFVQGLAGQLIRDQALTVSFSLLASLAVAFTIVPTLSALGHRRTDRPAPVPPEAPSGARRGDRLAERIAGALVFLPRLALRGLAGLGRRTGRLANAVFDPFDRAFEGFLALYPRVARWALTHPKRVLAWSTAALLGSIGIGMLLPVNLFPSPSQGEFTFSVRLPEGTALPLTDRVLTRLGVLVEQDPRVKFVYTSAGQRDLSAFSGSALEPNRGQLTVVMKQVTDRKGEETVVGVLRDAMAATPGLDYEFERPALLKFKNAVEIELYADNLDTLRTLSATLARRIEGVRGIQDVEASARPGDPEVQIAFDRDRLASLGLDPAQASRLVRNAVQGEAATQFTDLDRKLDVRVRASEAERSQVAQLADLEVGRNDGRPVRLGAVANVLVERGPSEIRRIGQQRAAVVTANLKGRDLGSASKDIRAQIEAMNVPLPSRVLLAGQNRELAESTDSLRFAILLAMFLVYLVMASQFESLLHPFVLMFSIPLAVVGVALALGITGTSISVMVLIGMVILAGIVVKNAIVLVDYANRLRKQGRGKIDALVEAGSVRMRPIIMTTLTTVLGLLPMALGFGEGVEVRAPLAITLIGGLVVSTMLTLVVIPVVYVTFDRS